MNYRLFLYTGPRANLATFGIVETGTALAFTEQQARYGQAHPDDRFVDLAELSDVRETIPPEEAKQRWPQHFDAPAPAEVVQEDTSRPEPAPEATEASSEDAGEAQNEEQPPEPPPANEKVETSAPTSDTLARHVKPSKHDQKKKRRR